MKHPHLLTSSLSIGLSVVTALNASGCAHKTAWAYPPPDRDPYFTREDPVDLEISVTEFSDKRGHERTLGTFFLHYVPLFPYGWSVRDRPEREDGAFWGLWDIDLTDAFAAAAGQELEDSRLVHKVTGLVGEENREPWAPNYVLRGNVTATRRCRTQLTYGLSVFAGFLWLMGLPDGSSELDLGVDLELWRPDTGVVWRHEAHASSYHVKGLYYNVGYDLDRFPSLLAQCFDQALPELEAFLRQAKIPKPVEPGILKETPRETISRLWRRYLFEHGEEGTPRDFFAQLEKDLPSNLKPTWQTWEAKRIDPWQEVRRLLVR